MKTLLMMFVVLCVVVSVVKAAPGKGASIGDTYYIKDDGDKNGNDDGDNYNDGYGDNNNDDYGDNNNDDYGDNDNDSYGGKNNNGNGGNNNNGNGGNNNNGNGGKNNNNIRYRKGDSNAVAANTAQVKGNKNNLNLYNKNSLDTADYDRR